MVCRTFEEIMEDVKTQLRNRRGASMKQLARTFAKSEAGINGNFDLAGFTKVLNEAGVFLRTQEVSAIFKAFLEDGATTIKYKAFLDGVARGRLQGRRRKIIMKAFIKMDKDESGTVPLQELMNAYNIGGHPKVETGELKQSQAYAEVLAVFDGTAQGEKKKREKVPMQVFMNYFAELSAYYPSSDDAFVRMVEKAFKVRETVTKEMQELDKKRLDYLKDQIREKVRQRTQCSKFENVTLYRACRHFDTDDSGDIDSEEFANALSTLGIHLPVDEREALFNSFGLSANGTITYWDFSKSLFKGTEPDISTSMTKTIGRKGPVEAGPAKVNSPIARNKVPLWAQKHAAVSKKK